MKNPAPWADSHSHLADPRIADPAALIREARAQGIRYFLQGGVGPEDWQRQKSLAEREEGVLPVFGLHPYWITDHSQDECEAALDQLARELPRALALGETGLDFRPHILKDSMPRQVACFELQLEMARVAHKPVILHVVRAFDEAIQILDFFGAGTRGMVHAFGGSLAQAEAYLQRNYLISVGASVLKPDAHRLHQAVAGIPLTHLLLETDSPDQPPPGWPAQSNTPSTLLLVAEKIAEIKKVDRSQILDKSWQNLRKLLDLPEERGRDAD